MAIYWVSRETAGYTIIAIQIAMDRKRVKLRLMNAFIELLRS